MPFRTISGHHRVLSLLSRACAEGVLPPSLLLAGPAGVGKRRTAIAIAEVLNCLEAQSVSGVERDSCGVCASCRRIARGIHPDVLLVEPGDTGSIKIEQVRDVVDRAGYRPFEGRRRVVIIDEADAMVEAAQNALLKTLEEPPPASVFILVSSIPDALLPTVLSRCPRLRFSGLTPAEVAEVLIRDHGYAEPLAHTAAANADGSIAQALAAQSADLVEAREAAQRLLEQAAGSTDPVRLLESAKELTGRRPTTGAERDQLALCLRALASLLRDIGLLVTGSAPGSLANADLQPELAPLVRAFTAERAERAFAAVDHALGALERNASPKLVADWLVLQL
jgi:DNA polymerase-3 subunit delta'